MKRLWRWTWWNVRFSSCAFLALPWEHPRVQALAQERLTWDVKDSE